MRLVSAFNRWAVLITILVPLLFLFGPDRVFESWRRFYPLPPVPARKPLYAITDKGQTTRYFHWGRSGRELRLRDDGTIRDFREDEVRQEIPREMLSINTNKTRFGPEFDPMKTYIVDMVTHDHALLRNEKLYLRNSDDQRMYWTKNGAIRGYGTWPFYRRSELTGINKLGDVIGNASFDTDTNYFCGGYRGHSRSFGLVWRNGSREVEDVNSLIAVSTGWYIDHAIDINSRGEILCFAHRSDALETADMIRHLVILSPKVK